MSTFLFLRQVLEKRLERPQVQFLRDAAKEIAEEVSDARFCALLSSASRHVRPRPLAPDGAELEAAGRLVPGWNPERWTLLEALRAVLVLARPDLARESAECALGEAFRFADEGELCALYRTLALLPEPRRFVWRAGEGCRSNMRSVFEAAALDSPFPATWFDDTAWRQAVLKCVFVDAPLWRLWGLDGRLSPELARMALDLADERRSAGRPVPHELWLCLGEHGGERGLESLRRELDASNQHRLGRRAAAYGLARAGAAAELQERCAAEKDALVAGTMRAALEQDRSQLAFRDLDPRERTA